MKKKDAKTFGQRLRQQRGKMTQVEFADILGIKQAMVSRYEADKETPSSWTLLAMARFTGKSIQWLLTGKEEISPPADNSISKADLIKAAGKDLAQTDEPAAQDFVAMMNECFKNKRRMEKVLHFYHFLKNQQD